MQFRLIQKTLGLLLLLFSPILIPPMIIGLYSKDGTVLPFLYAFLILFLSSLCLWLPARKQTAELRIKEGFLVVTFFWLGLGLSGALPFILIDNLKMGIIDAIFESISGLTTTGATVLTGLDQLPKSILFYRQELQWFGGMGIIVLAVAVLPMLGIGGMQLYRAETPGPMKEAKITPRITETAKALWYLYLGFTVTCTMAYFIAGMDLFDAITHSLSTVSIGGFSTHDMSIGHFNSPLIEFVASFFMCLAGINFILHFSVWRKGSLKRYWQDTECRVYLTILLSLVLICILYLSIYQSQKQSLSTIIETIFQTISIATTTGFTIQDYQYWPAFLPTLLLLASFIGACAGSTGGGLKVIRVVLLYKQGVYEVKRLIHPHAVFQIKIANTTVTNQIIYAVWGFFAAYVALFTFLLLALMATGLEQVSAFSAVAACINNLGPGLGVVSSHYGDINCVAKILLCIAMLAGRLEIFTLVVLCSRSFWLR